MILYKKDSGFELTVPDETVRVDEVQVDEMPEIASEVVPSIVSEVVPSIVSEAEGDQVTWKEE